MNHYRRRFSRDEFSRELRDHIASKPETLTDDELDTHVQNKAMHYEEAITRLDRVKHTIARLRDEADRAQDTARKKQLDLSIKEIDEAIDAYGVASLDQNANWQHAE